KDPEFKGYLDGLRQDLQDGDKALAAAEKTLEFVDGPVKARDDAAAELAKGKAEKAPDEKVKLLTGAQDGFKRCAEDAEKAISATPSLEKSTVATAPRAATGAAVVKECKQQADAAAKLLVSAKKVADLAAKKAAAEEAKKAAAEKKAADLAAKKAAVEEKKAAAAEAKKAAAEKKAADLAEKKAALEEKKKADAEKKAAAAEAKKKSHAQR
ncbi:MAG TPA: hypothetical protein VND93_00185, partial [Myxococcales bacterium]|nr:hypothetical protein [Myxococcales bacterium]